MSFELFLFISLWPFWLWLLLNAAYVLVELIGLVCSWSIKLANRYNL